MFDRIFKFQVLNRFFLIFFIIGSIFSSCISRKSQVYFQGLKDSTYYANMEQAEPIIQRGDQLFIKIYALDPLSAAYFNMPAGMDGQAGVGMVQTLNNPQGAAFLGYLVNEQGEIDFPKLGSVKVMGMTQQSLRDSMQNWLLPYLKEPIASVRLLNFRVTYLTADRATTVVIQNNKTNLLQFLGMVGGVTREHFRLRLEQDNIESRPLWKPMNLQPIFESAPFYGDGLRGPTSARPTLSVWCTTFAPLGLRTRKVTFERLNFSLKI